MKKSFASLAFITTLTMSGFASVSVSSPTSGATVQSPVKVVASATSRHSITKMEVLVDGKDVYSAKSSSLTASIPMSSGAHTITVDAWNSDGRSYSDSLSVKVAAASTPPPTVSPLQLTTSTLAPGTVGSSYSATLAAKGGTPPYTWSLASGSLPASLKLSTSGTISGTPTTAGVSTFAVTVKDSATSLQAATETLSLTMNSATSTPPPMPNALNYYISPSGSDSNNCTASSPCKTINSIDSRLGSSSPLGSSGTVINVAPGTYSGAIVTKRSGTANARIRYISTTQYGAILTKGSGSIWEANGSYTDVVGFDFAGSSESNAISTDNGSSAVGTNHVRILNNRIHDTASGCNSTEDAVILLNASDASGSYMAGDNEVSGNLLYHNNCGQAGSNPSNSGQHGVYSALSGDVISNNVIVDQGGGWCIQAYHRVTNWTVVNNTMAACGNGGIVLDDDSSTGVSPQNTTIVNNIVANSGASSTGNGGINLRDCGGSNNVIENNLMYGNTPSNYTGSCSGATLSSTQSGTNSTAFVNYTGTGAGNYQLKTGSAAITTGSTSCASGMSPCTPTIDFLGSSRSQGGTIDIGAYQYGSTDPSYPWQ